MMCLTKWLSATLAIALLAGTAAADPVATGKVKSIGAGPDNRSYGFAHQVVPMSSVRYASERSSHRFAGATRVVLDKFDPLSKDPKSASLQLDKNDVTYSVFGEPRITTVFYQTFLVKLSRLEDADPDGRDRCIFSVELPKEQAAELGASSLRLVAMLGAKAQPRGVRLLLMNPKGQVTDTLELRPPGIGPGTFSVSR